MRKISKTPFKVLDAPSLQDDYYLNLVDWSHANVLSVALGSCVYLWSACTSKVTKLCDLGVDDAVTSISWATTGSQISVGTNSGKILIWDAATCKQVREMVGHDNRVGTMAWSSTLLASGSRDRNIYLQDVRIRSHSSGTTSGSSPHNTSSNSRNNNSYTNSNDTTAIRGYMQPGHNTSFAGGIASPDRNLTGSMMRGGSGGGGNDGSFATMNLSVAMHPPGSIRRNSEGYPSHSATSSSYISPGSGFEHVIVGRHSWGSGDTSVSLMDTTEDDAGGADAATLPQPPRITHAPPHHDEFRRRRGRNDESTLPPSAAAAAAEHSSSPCLVRKLSAHKQEVCGLKWSFDEKMLASGGNDNKLFVWDAAHAHDSEPLCRLEDHTAAVKAVAWSPHQHGLLASGGGTADRHIRFWNALTSVPLHKIDTGSQVGS